MRARFDDLRALPGRSVELTDPLGEIRADDLGEVRSAIATAEAAAAAGEWLAGFVAYEAAPAFDAALTTRPPSTPLVWFGRFAGSRAVPLPPPTAEAAVWEPEIDNARYRRDLGVIAEKILAGDTYQVNHTFRLRSTDVGDPLGRYAALALGQRGGHHAFIDTGALAVACASPESFFTWDCGRLEVAPMKGTRPRGRWPAEDAARADELMAADKDRAEHVMIVDLLRNDLGRLAVPGSVAVERLFDLEAYPTVWQMTSTISAHPRPGTALVDVFAALFPCGSVTGAPKASTMRLIADLERSARGVYCGAVGLLAPPDSGAPRARFAVPIRTLVVDRRTGLAEFGVGGGIVHDSDPDEELAEARLKALVLDAPPPVRLLETLRWQPTGGVAWLDQHLRRLADGATRFGVRVEAEAVRAAIDEAVVGADGHRRLRVTVAADGSVEVEATPIGSEVATVTLALDDRPIDPSDPYLFHKTTRRDRYEAAAGRRPDVDQVVLWNPDGWVTETTVANLAVSVGGRWLTPPVEHGLLPGVARAAALKEGWLSVAPVSIEDLHAADEVRVMNAVWPLRRAVVEDPRG